VYGHDGRSPEARKARPDRDAPGTDEQGVEIASDVADGPFSVILDQVTNGVAVRMAVLYLLLGAEFIAYRGAHADEDALLLGQAPCNFPGILVPDRDDLVEDIPVQDLRDEPGANPLDLVRPGLSTCQDRRILRLYPDDPDRRLAGLQDLAQGPQALRRFRLLCLELAERCGRFFLLAADLGEGKGDLPVRPVNGSIFTSTCWPSWRVRNPSATIAL
jgi:hypothetical protein